MKMYAGRRPSAEEGWTLKKDFFDEDQTWLLFEKPQPHNDQWVTYKVIADGRVQKKANYWMVKNKNTGQIAYPADMELMRQHRKNLFDQIQSFI